MVNIQAINSFSIDNSRNSLPFKGKSDLRLQPQLKTDIVAFSGEKKTPNQTVDDAMMKHYVEILGTDAIAEYLASKGCSKNTINIVVKKLQQEIIDLNTNVLEEANVQFSKKEADAALLYFKAITPVKKQMNEITVRKFLMVKDKFLTKPSAQITAKDKELTDKALILLGKAVEVDENGNNSLDESKFKELKDIGINFTNEEKQIVLAYKQTYDNLLKQNPLVKQFMLKAGYAQEMKVIKMSESGQSPDDYFDKVLSEAINSVKR